MFLKLKWKIPHFKLNLRVQHNHDFVEESLNFIKKEKCHLLSIPLILRVLQEVIYQLYIFFS